MKKVLSVFMTISINCSANTYFCSSLLNSEDPKQSGVARVDNINGLFRAATDNGEDNEIISKAKVTPYGWRWLEWNRSQECRSTLQTNMGVTKISFSCRSAENVGLDSALEFAESSQSGKYSGNIIAPPGPDVGFSVTFKDCIVK